jgi:uncharacterized protein (DUF433 family)/DNA-binding transcriptional MerR regulator
MNLTGIGLYSIGEASRLTEARPYQIRRWLFGYSYRGVDGKPHPIPPLWTTQLAGADIGGETLGFHDLLELRFVLAFIRNGVSLQVIRATAAAARLELHSDYPFTTKRFRTDGKTIFFQAVRDSGESGLMDLRKRQFAFDAVIRPSLYAGIEFRSDGRAERWFPVPQSKQIVIDPDISFGRPVVEKFGVPTEALYASFKAEGHRARVARIFEVPLSVVSAAVKFEQRLAA